MRLSTPASHILESVHRHGTKHMDSNPCIDSVFHPCRFTQHGTPTPAGTTGNWLAPNPRVPGSSPGTPHQAFRDFAPFRVGHSDNSSPAHSDKFPLSVLAFKRVRAPIRRSCSVSWEYEAKPR